MNEELFAERLGMLIAAHGYNTTTFALEVGVSAASVSRYLNKIRLPEVGAACRMAQVLNVNIGWLLGVDGEEQNASYENTVKEIGALYNIATPDDKAVVDAVLKKYRKIK